MNAFVEEVKRDAENRQALVSRLVSLRIQSGKTMRDIAEPTELSVSTVWRIEQKDSNPTVRQLQLYARALGCRLVLNFKTAVNSCSQCGWVGQGECPRGPGDHE